MSVPAPFAYAHAVDIEAPLDVVWAYAGDSGRAAEWSVYFDPFAPLPESPQLAGFRRGLEPMNRLAERSPGFVWRLLDAAAAATAFGEPDDGLFLLNFSLWESVDALRAYASTGGLAGYLKCRTEWFAAFGRPHVALWWVPAGHRPTLAEARQRLDGLHAHGPTPAAFTFAPPFPPPAC